jgi:hypothetical protein
VLNPSAVKCVHSFEICGYCDLCSAYLQPGAKARDSGADARIIVSADSAEVARADRIVLPGVGAFADCRHGLEAVSEIFSQGVKIEVGDMLPSSHYAQRLTRVPPAWEKAFEVNASSDPAMRASCVEFVLAGLYATEQVSRAQHHGRIVYEIR